MKGLMQNTRIYCQHLRNMLPRFLLIVKMKKQVGMQKVCFPKIETGIADYSAQFLFITLIS